MRSNFLVRKESFRVGAKRTFKPPSIDANSIKQYAFEDNTAGIGYLVEKYGYLNFFTVVNNDAVDIEIQLDFMENKTYPVPYGSSIGVDEIQFREFNIKNLDTIAATTAGKIMVVVGYEAPLERERQDEIKTEQLKTMFSKKGWWVQ